MLMAISVSFKYRDDPSMHDRFILKVQILKRRNRDIVG